VLSQRSPGARQPIARHRPLRQVRPEQQPSLEVQLSEAWLQAQVPTVPPSGRLQRAPPQQSRFAEQDSSRRRHTHAPLVQSIEPQHSREVLQAPIAGRQQKVPPGCAPQE